MPTRDQSVLPHVKTNLQEYGFLNEWEDYYHAYDTLMLHARKH